MQFPTYTKYRHVNVYSYVNRATHPLLKFEEYGTDELQLWRMSLTRKSLANFIGRGVSKILRASQIQSTTWKRNDMQHYYIYIVFGSAIKTHTQIHKHQQRHILL